MKKLISTVLIGLLASCAANDNPARLPISGISLLCKNENFSQELDILIFDSSVLVGAGAGYTVTMTQATNDNGTIKYEEDYSKVSALWNTNDSWIYFKAENPYAPTQRLYTGDNAMECIIVRKLNKEQATAVYNDIPCIKNECE